jgi:hypothetical protein
MTLARKLLIALESSSDPIVAIGTLLVALAAMPTALPGIWGGGCAVAGGRGPEPDWSFAHDLPTIELQLLTRRRSQ